MGKYYDIASKGFAYALIGVVLLLTLNKTRYVHSHILDNGTVITHAHPYEKGGNDTPFPPHHHHNSQLLIFSMFSFLPLVFFSFAFTLILKKTIFFRELKVRVHSSTCPRFILGRAPPCLC